MGYLDKTSLTVTAHFTKRGRETLANAFSGATDDSYVITQFALGDDEIDYGLWEQSQPPALRGRVIENMPLLESYLNQSEIMNSFIIDTPEIPYGSTISGVPSSIILEGRNDIVDIIPKTDNFSWVDEDGETQFTEQYEFFVEQDNLFEMFNPFVSPFTNFNMMVAILDSPVSNFIMSAESPPVGDPPDTNFIMSAESPPLGDPPETNFIMSAESPPVGDPPETNFTMGTL
jgi:hypothetical protein